MRATTDRKSPDGPARGIASAPRKRFQIEKLEERIAPKKGGKGTNNCPYGSGIY